MKTLLKIYFLSISIKLIFIISIIKLNLFIFVWIILIKTFLALFLSILDGRVIPGAIQSFDQVNLSSHTFS